MNPRMRPLSGSGGRGRFGHAGDCQSGGCGTEKRGEGPNGDGSSSAFRNQDHNLEVVFAVSYLRSGLFSSRAALLGWICVVLCLL